MTKKQLAALRRILDREKAAYQVRSGRPAPGQHPSEDKYAIADGTICVLMDGPEAALPVGEQADTFARSGPLGIGIRTARSCRPKPLLIQGLAHLLFQIPPIEHSAHAGP